MGLKPVFYSIVAVFIGFIIVTSINLAGHGSREKLTNSLGQQLDELTVEGGDLKGLFDQEIPQTYSEWSIVLESLALNLIIAFGIYFLAKRRL
ncbi:MAG: hypothetical protein ACUVV4_03415 [Candidatus Bathyarchaeia archaeon]